MAIITKEPNNSLHNNAFNKAKTALEKQKKLINY